MPFLAHRVDASRVANHGERRSSNAGVARGASEGLYAMLRPEFSSWPEKCRRTRAVHFGINPARPDVTLVDALRNAGCGLISIEPFTHAPTPLSASALRELMSLGDVWSPNERESKSFFADGETMSPEELVGRMRDAGANKVICLRRGALGAVAYDARTGEGYACEAFPVSRVVDETGCGNCFCGAFAASVLAGDGLRDALTLASAAARLSPPSWPPSARRWVTTSSSSRAVRPSARASATSTACACLRTRRRARANE